MDEKKIIEEMVKRSRTAQLEYERSTQEQVDAIVKAIAMTVYENAGELAKMAVDETRMGVYEHKVKKNKGKAKIIWNSLKGAASIGILNRNEVSGITEIARPVGVVGAITPCTNPIVTPMCNAMFALKGANSIIIAPHPRAKKCAVYLTGLFNMAIRPLGAPDNLIQVMEEPSLELTNELMKGVDVIVATGGMAMVRAAYGSGKPAFGVGAGNVQCIFDRDIDIVSAVKKVIEGREFDNGIICSGEQTVIAPADTYDEVIKAFVDNNCVYIDDPDKKAKLRDMLFPSGVMNRDLVGVTAQIVAHAAGICVPDGTRAIVVKADAYGIGDLFSKEKMCPVISAYSYTGFAEAVMIARENLDVEGRGHSVSIHSNNRENIEYAGRMLTVSRILINQICSTMNGGSFFNGLTPTTTLGCGSWGGNSISENLTYKHLLNVIRIAYPKKNAVVPADDVIWRD